ncbi:MAG TPA: Fic family protein [Kiritimatiellia bacterium]|nr:Fic family protein [Kiritimatiellia bacterium]HMO97641.1 Fic family protein [Kiritimatiellia bacterium]HMP97431.1 Fic family protein [Kiritimatiellia bacterium]
MDYKPLFEITPHLLQRIATATERKTWIAHAIIQVPWLNRLQRESAARLAHASTAIEGNPLSLSDVQTLASGERTADRAGKEEKEALNYLSALRWIRNQPAMGKIRESDILELHRRLTAETLSPEAVGVYKVKANRIVDAKGRTVYTPPPPSRAGPQTRALIDWIHSPEAYALHPVITSAIAHHRLVSIHPFADGNGRIARALATWLLYSRGFDTEHIFALDDFFEADRQRYYDTLQQARDLDDVLTYWIEYVAEGICATLTATQGRIETLQREYRGITLTLTKRQEEVLRLLRDYPRLKSPDFEKAFAITRARVAQIIGPLVDAGLVVREGQTRATYYRLAR